MLRRFGWFLILVVLSLTACNTNNTESPSGPAPGAGAIETEADGEGVSIMRADQREDLPGEEQTLLKIGEGISVTENGRALLRLDDLLTADLFHGGEIVFEEFAADEASATITIRQTGGMLLNDFNPNAARDRRLTIETEFATVTTPGARFLIMHEANTPLEWVVNLGPEDTEGSSPRAGDDIVQVTTGGQTQNVRRGAARWVAPGSAPGQSIAIDLKRVRAWLNTIQSGETDLALSEVLLAPANTLGQTGSLTTVPQPGQTFELEANQQGSVQLSLDPIGLFGRPAYRLEDCNGDGQRDLVLENGKLDFDFRPMLARALALDVTVVNRAQPGQGALWGLDPAGDEIDRVVLQAGPDRTDTLSLRGAQPFHTAALALSDGCFVGFSLTPPDQAGQPAQPRAAATVPPGDVVVNILEQPDERGSTDDNQLEAVPLSSGSVAIQIDGDLADWETLAEQSGLDWTRFDTITFDQGCANRFPEASTAAIDLGGQVHFAYDETNLYVAFQVDDDGYVKYSGDDETYFLGDSPQLSLDMDLLGDFNDGNRSADDWQVDFLPDLEASRVALWQLGTLTSRSFDEARVAVAPTETGYLLEAALPWASFSISPQPGDRLGIAANINDNDTPGTNAQECIISTAPEREWNVPTTWGTLLLRPGSR